MKKIVVIDDHPAIVQLIKQSLLMRGGYKIFVAYDGLSGLSHIVAELPDCIILDLKMPGMNGSQVVQHLRTDMRTATIPVIIVSAQALDEDRVKDWLLETDEYLRKPFLPTALLATLDRVIEKRQVDS
jgi:DNA-binding response OmpR family regulator